MAGANSPYGSAALLSNGTIIIDCSQSLYATLSTPCLLYLSVPAQR